MAEKLSNVIGAPFDQYILDQLYIRAARNSTTQRSNEEVLFLANKTSWARLISSVNITAGNNSSTKPITKFYEELGLGSNYTKPEDLARNWILEAGTSIKSGNGIGLRSGIGTEGAYGLGGIDELGYRPMPGLSGVQVETVGRLGSLRQANITFKVWNMNQLNIVEALYFRLGYSMLLEWGHTQYFSNPSPNSPGSTFTLATNTFGLEDPFATGINKTTVQQRIAKKAKESSGNYDGMLGIVSNFNWSFNQEGGYDCTVKLIGLGSIIDTLRINQSYKMPPGLVKEFKTAQEAIQTAIDQQAQRDRNEAEAKERRALGLPPTPPQIPTNPGQIYTQIFSADIGGATTTQTESDFLSQISYTTAYTTQETAVNSVYDYFYRAQIGGNPPSQLFIAELNQGYTGLFLSPIPGVRSNWQVVFAENPQPVQLSRAQLSLAATRFVTTGNISLNDTLGEDPFIKVVDLTIRNSKKATATSIFENLTNLTVGPEEKIFQVLSTEGFITGILGQVTTTGGITLELKYKALVADPTYGQEEKTFFITVTYQPLPFTTEEAEKNRLTRTEFIEAIKAWFVSSRKININSIKSELVPDFGLTSLSANYNKKRRGILVQGTLVDLQVPNKTSPIVTVTFNNTALIENVLTGVKVEDPVQPATQTANSGDTAAAENTATAPQTEVAAAYQSALHVMLSYIKTVSLAETVKANTTTENVVKVSILDATKAFYQDGILKNVFNTIPSAATFNTTPFNLTSYAQKGFNSNLLTDALTNTGLFELIPTVDYKALCNAYLVKYKLSNQATDNIEYPVYITLGYLLAFLNNMCLLYDSKQEVGSNNSPGGLDKTPYVYIDFNPETNFCLTSPQHLSVDPTVCLIPFQGGNENYASIFPDNIAKALSATLFKPKAEDRLSGRLPEFKSLGGNPYQGKTMNILLNIDFLLGAIDGFVLNSSENSIDLQSFLDKVVVEINKSLGKINLFRVSYRDDSNTVQIKDDQWVPNLPGEVTILNRTSPESSNKGIRLGELPIFGSGSLVRAFQLKTSISTKLGSMIAISAQAATGSINATDPSSLSYLNANYQDRFKPYIVESSGKPVSGDTESKATESKKDDQSNNDLIVGEHFNTLVKSVYSDFSLDTAKIDTAKNYYIERMSKEKSNDPVTSAAPFIPADLEMTIDGIAGILMGNAFTIPESRLPLSLRGIEGKPKVGFIVAGLTHTIQENQWLVKIRGQMIKLRDTVKYSVAEVNEVAIAPTPPTVLNTIRNTPWSAAFISFVMQRAGVPFPFSAAHTRYVQTLRTNAQGFQTLDSATTSVQVGDIVVRNRNGNNMTYASNPWSGPSHGDIIVEVNGNLAIGIGGNISDTVFRSRISLTQGRLAERDYFVILRPPKNYIQAIVSVAEVEYKLWNSNKWIETTQAASDTLRTYYKTVGINI